MNDTTETDIDVDSETGAGLSVVPASAGALSADLDEKWMTQTWRIAQAVGRSGMVPPGMKNVESIWIAIMHGREIGLRPMQALQSIAVINNRPSIYGDGALGIVRRSGLMEKFREWIEGTGDDMVAWCETKRRGEEPIIRSFSVDDAKRAKLWMKKGKNGSDTPWVTYPKRMLAMRARAFALRDAYADVFRGLHMAEEAIDMEPILQPNEVRTSGVAQRLASGGLMQDGTTHAENAKAVIAASRSVPDAPAGSGGSQAPADEENAPTRLSEDVSGPTEESDAEAFTMTREERNWLYDLTVALAEVTTDKEMRAVLDNMTGMAALRAEVLKIAEARIAKKQAALAEVTTDKRKK